MNRRGFLKSFLAAAAGIALAPVIAPTIETVAEAVVDPEIISLYPLLKAPTPDLHGGPLTREMWDRMRAKLRRPFNPNYHFEPDPWNYRERAPEPDEEAEWWPNPVPVRDES